MPSPFPGMDPYLENPAIWPDFHGSFLMAIRAELNRKLPEGYVARWDRYVWIDEAEVEQPGPLGRPDVFVTDKLGRDAGEANGSVLTAPAVALLPIIDPKGKPFVKIIDVHRRRVVTVLELLSIANKKPGKDRDAYLAKRQEYFSSGTNLVELDLLRSGQRTPIESEVPPANYYILVSRAVDFPRVGIWFLSVRDVLPNIPIPLDPQIEPVEVDLRKCLDRAYDEDKFVDDIDYADPPDPPLAEADAAWAREILGGNPVK